MIYKMTLKDSADEITFNLLEVPIVDKDIEGAVDNVTLDGNQYTDYLWLKKQFIQKWSILCDDEYTRLRGFYTRQFENADVPSYRLYYGDDIIRNSTLSGEYIQFSVGGVADGTMSLTQIDGNTIQDGTPTPSAPVPVQTVTGRQTVGIVGKNLYDPNSTVFSVPANVSVEVEGNSVKVTALITTTSSNLYWRTPIPDSMLEDGKTYTISSVLGSGAYRSLRLLLRNHDGSNAGFSTGYSVTYDSRYTLFVVENPFATTGSTQVTAGTTCTISNIQVEEGSTATTYEPYEAQNYEINLTGKNMLDVSVGYRYGFIQSNGQYADNNIIVLFNGFIPVEPSTTYTFSSNHANWNMTAVLYADMTTFIDRNLKSGVTANTFTTPSNCHFVRLQVNYDNQAMTDEIVAGLELQLEKASSASAYEAYHSINLCRIRNHRDRIYKNLENGKWYLHKEISCELYDGTESGWRSDAGRIEYQDSSIMLGSSSDNAVVCDYYTTAWGVGTCIFISGTRRAVCILDSNNFAQNLDLFKAWIANHNLTIAYALATPTTTEITGEALVEELEALQDEAISVGQHNIYTDTPNALPTLTFDLTEYLSKSTTIIPETAVRLTLTDGGVINACGCRKDVQLTMRETIE